MTKVGSSLRASPYGGEFRAEDGNDQIEVRLRCALSTCHNLDFCRIMELVQAVRV